MEDARKTGFIILSFSGLIVILVGMDLVTDYLSGGSGLHIILEGMLLVASGSFFLFGINRLSHAKLEIKDLKVDVENLVYEKEKWKGETQQLLEGLSIKIEKQFTHWKLSPAEMDVGFLLLKGFSLKEISDLRNTKVKTVQQQSQAIYYKTGLASRSELSAFFLEDLLPPK
ncbi:MAG: helix-turn-helix transcriptional regulator [Nitrospinales bacterium]